MITIRETKLEEKEIKRSKENKVEVKQIMRMNGI